MDPESLAYDEATSSKVLNISFDFIDPRPEFAACTRSFLYSTFDDNCPVADLAEKVANQVETGTYLITVSEESAENSVLGVISLLSLSVEDLVTEYIREYLRGKENLVQYMNNAAFLIYERVVNIPSQLIAPLHNQLVQDVQWARENGHEASFEYLILISRCMKTLQEGSSTNKKRPNDSFLFFKLEDDVFIKHAAHVVVYNAESGRALHAGVCSQDPVSTDDDADSHKIVMVLKWEEYLSAVQEIEKRFPKE